MVRPRKGKSVGLPSNLTYDTATGLYRYRHPITKKRTYLTANRTECIKTADKLNGMLTPAKASLVDRVVKGSGRWETLIDRYLDEVFPDLDIKPKTESQYRTYYAKLRGSTLAGRNVGEITVADVVEALDAITSGKRMRNVYRNRLARAFQFGMQLGWCDSDPASTTRIVSEKRQRVRLTMDGFRAVYAKADDWLKVAMDMAMVTLQRRNDLVRARYTDANDERLRIEQGKTGRRLEIQMSAELREVIQRSRDSRVCPFIIHRSPRRIPPRQKWAANREHAMQIMPDQLTEAFSDALKQTDYYKGEPNPPTFHEIRSLGADRYRKAGWSDETIQTLMGHEEVSMTEDYLAGHERPWESAPSGLPAK